MCLQLPVTIPKPFNLGLNQRVEERQHFKAESEKRQKEIERRQKIQQDEKEEEDRRELKEYRKSLVFKVKRKLSVLHIKVC